MKEKAQGAMKAGKEEVIFSAETLDRWVHACIRVLLGVVLSGAVVLEDCAPFGVALTAASGAGLLGGGACLGACLGSLCRLELTRGLRYASASMLVYAFSFALYDVKALKRPWTMPVAAGAAMVFTAWVAHSRTGWNREEEMTFLLELGLTVGAVWCFRAALRRPTILPRRGGMRGDQRGGLLVLLGVLLMALVPLAPMGVSLGRCLGGVLVLWAAWLGGGQAGAVLGLVLGLGMDLAGEGALLRCVTWPLGGLAAGSWGRRSSIRTALSWTLGVCLCALWAGEGKEPSLLCAGECILSALLFFLLPSRWLERGEVLLPVGETPSGDPSGVTLARERLEGVARAYHTLCRTLKDSIRPPEGEGDLALIFDRAASRVCRSCANQALCWQREYSITFNALNDATSPMLERGRAVEGDFPAPFVRRCLHFSDFLGAVNEELTALFYRRQYQARIRDSRQTVCQQYEQLSNLLYETAEELGAERLPAPDKTRGLKRYLKRRGAGVEGSAWRDSRGLLHLSLRGESAAALAGERGLKELSRLTGTPLRLSQTGEREVLLVEEEPLQAVAGVAARKKDGETVSGDGGTYFKRPDGKAYLLLCDGMGSGEQANRESSLAIRLLEQLLGTGISAAGALLTLTSALALRGEETGGFTTVDLLEIDLFTGEGALYKLGAAPTYVRQGESLRRLTAASLPAGLAQGTREAVDTFTLRLAPGDLVLMVSDGICGTGEDGWLMERLRSFDGDSPRTLAARLIADSPQGATDDRTALVVKMEKRG